MVAVALEEREDERLAVAGDTPEGPVEVAPPADEPPPRMARRVLSLAWPVITQNLLETMVGVVDTFLVAGLGAVALAGVGAGLQVIFFLLASLSALSIGASIIVAHAVGAGDRAEAGRLAKQTLVWSAIGSVPLSLGGALAVDQIMRLFGVAPDVAAIGAGYLRVTMAMFPFMLLVFAGSAVLRGAGDTRTPLRVALLANVINAVLAYGLIYGHLGLPNLGAVGSGWAAALGRMVAAVVLVLVLLRGRGGLSLRGRDNWLPQFGVARRILALGVPAALEQTLISAAFTTLTIVIATLGTQALATQRIVFNALSVAFLPGIGFSIAAATLVGQSLGARKPREGTASANAAAGWAVLWMGLTGLLFFIFARRIVGAYSNDPAVIELGTTALRVLAIQQPFWGTLFVWSGAIRGTGNTRYPLIANATSIWLAVGIGFLGVMAFDFSLPALWALFIPASALNGLANWLRFRRNDWYQDEVLGDRG